MTQNPSPTENATSDTPGKSDAESRRPRKYKLEDLMAEMPEGFPRNPEWEGMPPVGREKL